MFGNARIAGQHRMGGSGPNCDVVRMNLDTAKLGEPANIDQF